MMLLLDIGYNWNDIWIENALEDQRNDVDATGRSWFIALIVSGAIFVLLGLGGSVALTMTFHGSVAVI